MKAKEITLKGNYFTENKPDDAPKKINDFIIGETYTFVNEKGENEVGKCVEYNKETGRVKFKK